MSCMPLAVNLNSGARNVARRRFRNAALVQRVLRTYMQAFVAGMRGGIQACVAGICHVALKSRVRGDGLRQRPTASMLLALDMPSAMPTQSPDGACGMRQCRAHGKHMPARMSIRMSTCVCAPHVDTHVCTMSALLRIVAHDHRYDRCARLTQLIKFVIGSISASPTARLLRRHRPGRLSK